MHFRWRAEHLREARRRSSWRQTDLAERASVHVQTVKYWEGKKGSIEGYAPERFFEAFEAAEVDMDGIAPTKSRRVRQSEPDSVLALLYRPPPKTKTRERPRARPVKQKCGAKNRRGRPCAMKPEPGKNRCKFHGGRSTGPRTPEGRARIADAQRLRWKKHRSGVQLLAATARAHVIGS
jgi:transcriptional regulator with XRE-family HTH domain